MPQIQSYLSLMIFIILSSFLSQALAATQLDPVSVAIDRLKNNPPDPIDFSYIGIRCAALNMMIGEVFEYQGDGSVETKKSVKLYKDDGEAFNKVGIYMGYVGKQDDKYMMKQFEYFVHIYGDEAAENQKLNNRFWTPFLLSELKSCESVKPLFIRAFEKINNKYPQERHR
jgi:hypothetical protein